MEAYVAASLRERGDVEPYGATSVLERLPAWIKSAKNRAEVVKTIQWMRKSAVADALP